MKYAVKVQLYFNSKIQSSILIYIKIVKYIKFKIR
jgi:hypothetical protein